MPFIKLSDIHVPERLREETYGDLEELANSLAGDGQLQPILVEQTDHARHDTECEWTLIDGGRRYAAAQLLLESDPQRSILSSPGPGYIDTYARPTTDDPITALRLEYYANHYREDFSWKETAKYYRQVHETLVERAGPDRNWTVSLTAGFLGVTERTVYRYLELTEDPESLNDPEIAGADSFRAAQKKLQIKKEKRKRQARVEIRDKRESSQGVTEADFYAKAVTMVTHGDCKEWISTFEDDTVDFVHWDPPYGGEQEGGARTTHEDIDDSEAYAKDLMSHMIPEISRVLHPGGWFVIWFHQTHREWLYNQLVSAGFWVNPYECIWFKVDRVADGHEITRYLTNAYEPFFLCGLDDPDHRLVLNDSSPQNVFTYPLVRREARRHLMHKPRELLEAIINICTVPGEFMLDPSCGSGSIVEAAIKAGRPIQACELSETYFLASVDAAAKMLRNQGHTPVPSAHDPVSLTDGIEI